MILSDLAYSRAKWFALVFLPALGTFIFAVGGIYDLDWTANAVGVLVAFDTFLGVLLGISNKNYLNNGENFDGDLLITPVAGQQPDIHAALNQSPDTLANKDTITLRTKVVPGA